MSKRSNIKRKQKMRLSILLAEVLHLQQTCLQVQQTALAFVNMNPHLFRAPKRPRTRKESDWTLLYDRMRDDEFRKELVLPRPLFNEIVDKIRDDLAPKRATRVTRKSPEEQLAATLYHCFEGAVARNVEKRFDTAQSGLSSIYKRVALAIIKHYGHLVDSDLTPEECREEAQRTEELFGIPDICFAADGTHIKTRAPAAAGHESWKDKSHNSSILLHAVCDQDMLFRSVQLGACGHTGDSRQWKISKLAQKLSKPPKDGLRGGIMPVNLAIATDGAYQQVPWHAKPLPGFGLATHLEAYNERQRKARRVIERSFGVLKGQWKFLTVSTQYDVQLKITLSWMCILLHNLMILRKFGFDADLLAQVERNIDQRESGQDDDDDVQVLEIELDFDRAETLADEYRSEVQRRVAAIQALLGDDS